MHGAGGEAKGLGENEGGGLLQMTPILVWPKDPHNRDVSRCRSHPGVGVNAIEDSISADRTLPIAGMVANRPAEGRGSQRSQGLYDGGQPCSGAVAGSGLSEPQPSRQQVRCRGLGDRKLSGQAPP
jgi:hypothetical protein